MWQANDELASVTEEQVTNDETSTETEDFYANDLMHSKWDQALCHLRFAAAGPSISNYQIHPTISNFLSLTFKK